MRPRTLAEGTLGSSTSRSAILNNSLCGQTRVTVRSKIRSWGLQPDFLLVSRGIAPPRTDVGALWLQRDRAKLIAFTQQQNAEARLANSGRIRQHGRKTRLPIAGRRADDLEYLRRRGQLLVAPHQPRG